MSYDRDHRDDLDREWGETPEPAPAVDFAPIDGDFTGVIDACTIGRGYGGCDRLSWKIRITGPTHAGRIVWRDHDLAPNRDTLKWLKKDLRTLGIDIHRLSAVYDADVRQQFVGLAVEIRCQAKTSKSGGIYQQVYINGIAESDQPEMGGTGRGAVRDDRDWTPPTRPIPRPAADAGIVDDDDIPF